MVTCYDETELQCELKCIDNAVIFLFRGKGVSV